MVCLECDCEDSTVRRPCPTRGFCPLEKIHLRPIIGEFVKSMRIYEIRRNNISTKYDVCLALDKQFEGKQELNMYS